MHNKKISIPITIAICLVILMFVIILLKNYFSDSNDIVKNPQEGDITRYEWMELLCEQTGIIESKTSVPYFADVSLSNSRFDYIQSAVEWDVLNVDSKFNGDGYASGRFIALTALKTIGQDRIQIYLDTEDKINDITYIEIALENNLIQEAELTNGFSPKDAKKVLEKLNSLYFDVFWQDDLEHVKYQDNVVQLTTEDILQKNEDNSEIIVTDESISQLFVGTIIIFEQGNTGLMVARKIVTIGTDCILTLSDDVKLDEVLESLIVSDITEVTIDDIINYHQLSKVDGSIDNMKYSSNQEDIIIPTLSAKIQSKGFKISLSTKEKELKIKLTDNATRISYELPITKEVNVNCNYQVEFEIEKILVAAQLNYQFMTGIKYAEVALDMQTTLSGGVKKEKEHQVDKISLFKTPVPLGNGIVGANIEFFLMISIEGTISIEVEMSINACVRYEKEKGVRNLKQDISANEPSLKLNCDANIMFRIEPILVLFSNIKIIDIEADIGVTGTSEATIRIDDINCIEIITAFPIITISVCGDDDAKSRIGELVGTIEWEVITKEEACFHNEFHYELLMDGTSQFVDKCTYTLIEDTDINIDTNTDTNIDINTDTNTDINTDTGIDTDISIDTENVDRELDNSTTYNSNFYGYNLPLIFQFDYTYDENDNMIFLIEDKENYYLVKGSLICPESVSADVLDSIKIGEHFVTGSGRGYTLIDEKLYNNDQRSKKLLLGDDKKTYEIVNLPTFFMDTYTGTPYYVITSEDGINYQTSYINVKIRINNDTCFTDNDGKSYESSFDSIIKSGYFKDGWYGMPPTYNIHFSKEGAIDILTAYDIGSNGPWGGLYTEVWEESIIE